MKYYKELNEIGEVILLLTYNTAPMISNPLVVEITAEEYEKLIIEFCGKENDNDNEEIPSEIEAKALAYDIITGVIE